MIETLTKWYKPDAQGRARFHLIADDALLAVRDRLIAAGVADEAAEVTAEIAERSKDSDYWQRELARRSSPQAWPWNA